MLYPNCPAEDSTDCYWLATENGNGEGISFIDIGGTAYYAEDVIPSADGKSHDFIIDPNSPIVEVYHQTYPDGILCYEDLDLMFVCNVETGWHSDPAPLDHGTETDGDGYVASPPTTDTPNTTTETVTTPPTTLAETGAESVETGWVVAALFIVAGLVALTASRRRPRH